MALWIASYQSLANHPKVRRLAKRLAIGIPAAIGYLHLLWWWALDYAPTGELTNHEPEEIAIGAQWEGGAKIFIDALVITKFIDRDGDHLELHDWYEYAGKLIQRRERNAKRMREARAAHEQSTNGARNGHVEKSVQLQDQTRPDITRPDRDGDPSPTENPKPRLAMNLANACASGLASLDAATTITNHALTRLDPTEVERLIEWAKTNNARHPSMLWKPLQQRVAELGMPSLPESWKSIRAPGSTNGPSNLDAHEYVAELNRENW